MAGTTEGMAKARAARGVGQMGGRKPIAERFQRQIAAAEAAFAKDMAAEAKRYRDNVQPQEPEECPIHHRRLMCPDIKCPVESERIPYNHRAAQYAFDRLMGKPTTRSENAITLTFVQQLITAVVTVFGDVNAIPDPATRQVAFAQRCAQLGTDFASPAA